MKVEGGFVVGYDTDGNNEIDGLTWSMRLVLSTGEVDLSESAIEVSVFIASQNESRLTYNSELDSYTDFYDSNVTNTTYGTKFYDEVHINEILDAGEIVRIYVKLDTEISPNDKLVIMFISSVAFMKVTKTAPTGIETGVNILR